MTLIEKLKNPTTRVVLLKEQRDCDENDNERVAPAGMLGTVTYDRTNTNNEFSLVCDNGCWVWLDEKEASEELRLATWYDEPAITADILAYLNSAFQADPYAIATLLFNRVPCNKQLLDHPHVMCAPPPCRVPLQPSDSELTVGSVGSLGLLNGMLHALNLPRVSVETDDVFVGGVPYETMQGFVRYRETDTADAVESELRDEYGVLSDSD